MATADILAPVFHDITSRLTEVERKEARDRFCSVYGDKYKIHEDLVSLLNQCAKENKISPTNTVPLLEGLTSATEKRIEIRGIVEQFKHEQSSVIKEWEKHQPSEFVGRDIGWLGGILERHNCVVLWGASGVGKTKLAYTYMKSRNDIDHKVVDLRNIKSMEVIYVETLKQFGKLVSIEDASQGLVTTTIKNYVMSKRSLLLLDNADDFVYYPGEGIDLTSEFASLVKSTLEECSDHNVKIIITSRQQSEHPDAAVLHQEQLMSLEDKDAGEIIKSRMLHERDKDSMQTNKNVMKAVEQCKGLPLSLKVLGAALQEQGITLESLLPELKKKAEEWKILKQAERVELPEEDIYTYAVLASRFKQLSDTLQLAGVALSLFTRTFSLQSVAAVLSDCEESKIHMIINHLKGINFVNEENESVYDMHPKVREFLIGEISSTPMINEYYVKAKQNFIVYYRKQLVSASKLVDDNYLRAYDLFMESSSDFNFVFSEKDNEYIIVDNFDDNQNIVSLLHGVVKPDERLKLFENFADTALKRGRIQPGIQHLCHAAMGDSFYNPVETFKFSLLRVEHMLKTVEDECTSRSRKKQFDHLYGLYHYVRGEVLYRMIRVNFSLSDCETAKDSLEKSIGIRERLEPGGSTDIVRSYINLGNIYNITEDIHRRNENFDETEPVLEKALDVYNKALELREKLSPNGLHVDLPQILSNIGTIWNERGLLLQLMDRRAGRREENKQAIQCFTRAEEYFKQSLETEKELKLDGLYETSVKLVNMGDVQRYIKKPEEAMKSLIEALELRRIFKGEHEDTVLVLYRLGNLSMDMQKFKEAAGYYMEAFEMDERLPKDFHSAVRKQIREYLIIAYQMWGHRAGREESKRIKRETKELEKRIKELEAKEEKEGKGSADQAKGVGTGLEPKGGDLDRSEMDFQTSMAACDKYVDGEFNKTGGHVSFKYINASLTIPRNLTEDTQALRIYRAKEEDVKMNLSDSEFLVSDIIRVDSKFLVDLKNPAILEIRCDVLHSRIEKFFELFMLEYNPVSKQWTDVERTALKRKRFYWYDKNDYVPIIEGWINKFSMFAAVARPKGNSFSVPPSGLVWRPAEDGRISLAFPSGCFSEDTNTSCAVKVVHPDPSVVKLALEERGLLLSPAISVHAKNVEKPITVSLPLVGSDEKPRKEECLKILKKEDNYKAEFEVLDANPVFKSEDNSVVEVGVSGFSWMMAVWSSREIDGDRLKWIGDKMFRHAQYDVNVDVFKRTAVDDSIMVGVACTPVKANDMHWQERLKNLRVSGYEYVNSAPATERLDDDTLIRIIVEGQYIIAKSDIDYLRFNSRNFSPTPVILRENSQKDNGRWMRFQQVENKTILCSIPYHKDFKLVSDNPGERESRERNKPVRFLGMKFEKCDLECLNAVHNSFRNNLYKTGLDEAFVDELKIWSEDGAKKMAVRKLLEEVTRLFVEDDLTENWFSVFEDSTHPMSLRKNLTNVMKILNDQLITREWKKIEAEIESGNEGSKFLGSLTSRLQEIDRQPSLDFKGAMKEYVAKKHSALDLVRKILQVQKDGYLDEVYNVLDKIGRVVEDWMPCIYQ